MAVDTAAKRASSSRFMRCGYPGVIPSGTVDRQASVWTYSGILAGAASIGYYIISELAEKYNLNELIDKYNFDN